ncbi:hypothetical protein OSB04_022345 [Centaurea solstitialis]|uniref:Uncharacterized protein n=1 Tax=Centaurea solstitialis TaxID=347529 RepID=A0AA38W5U9_9ASTR|nr:hypothetical protein OSB04_022345 [Centaurea solstitialis]
MDFSRTEIFQRTRACYDKIYSERNSERNRNGGGGGGDGSVSGGDRVKKDRVDGGVCTGESSGKLSEGLRRRGEIDSRSGKVKRGIKRREELGKVSKRGKNVRESNLIADSESSSDDDDGVRLKEPLPRGRDQCKTKEDFGSGKAEKVLQSGKRKGKKLSRNGDIDESEDDCGSDDDKSFGRNRSKFNGEGVSGSGKTEKKFENKANKVCLGAKRGKSKNHKGVGAKRSQGSSEDDDDDDDDAVSYLGDDAKLSKSFGKNGSKSNHATDKTDNKSKGFVNNATAASNGEFSLAESEDDEGVVYLGDDVTCLDDYDPSHSSRVESNEVKVNAPEMDSVPVDDDEEHDDSQGLTSSEEDDSPEVELSEEDSSDWCEEDDGEAGDKDFIVISSSSSESEDGLEDENAMVGEDDNDNDDPSVLEAGNVGDTVDEVITVVAEKHTSHHGDKGEVCEGKYSLKGKSIDEPGKNKKFNFIEPVVGKKRSGEGNEKQKTMEGGFKKMRTDFDTEGWKDISTQLPSHLGPGPKLKNKQLIEDEPYFIEEVRNLDFSFEDDNNEGGEETFVQRVDEKVTEKAGKSTGVKLNGFGNKIDVIKILADSIRDGGDNKLLQSYVSPMEDNPPEETPPPPDRVLSYKFRFEDEEDMKPEKLECEVEMDGLFDEMNMCLQFSEIGNNGTSVGDRGDNDFLMDAKDQFTRCRHGKHLLTINDQFGIICRCCSYVEMEIRDILPPLCKNGRGGHGRHDIDKTDGQKISPDLQWGDCHPDSLHDSERNTYEKGTVWDLIPGVKETMYPHQREGFEFIWKKIAGGTYIEKLDKSLSKGGSGCIISHAPGTGKSRLTIVFLQAFMRMYPTSRPLIIAPRCMLLTWEEEFKKWDVDVPFYILNNNECSGQEDTVAASLLKQAGNGKNLRCLRMLKLYSWKKKPSVLGITYRLFESLAGDEGKRKKTANNPENDEIKRILLQEPTLLVLDEGHTPRNDQSLVWKALQNVKTKRSIILSGTPFQNNFDELYNTLCLVNPLLSFGITPLRSDELSRKRGWKNNAVRGQWDSITSSIRKSQHKLNELKAMIDPFVHVHKGTILQERLPGLRDALVVLKPTTLQQKILGRMGGGTKLSLENDHMMSLVSVHPSLLSEDVPHSDGLRKVFKMYEKDPRAGVKTHFLFELIKLSGALNEKVLVFSQYIKPLGFIMELLKKKFQWVEGRECLYMDGQQEEKHRQASINTLNDPKSEVKVLLASTRACSEGISLVGASRVVLLDVVWNPSVERQAISRAYRLGQTKMVHVYHLLTGTMEGEKYIRQVEKSHLSELVFASKNRDSTNPKISPTVMADKILEEMVQHEKLQHMFEKVIYQPKESDLIQTFG